MNLSTKTLEDYIQQFLMSHHLQSLDYEQIDHTLQPLTKKIEQLCSYTSMIHDVRADRYNPDSKNLVQIFNQLNTAIQTTKNDKLHNHLFILLEKFKRELKKIDLYYAEIRKQNEITAAYRHDRRNHIFCVAGLLAENEIEEALSYLNDLSQEQHGLFVVRTGNLVLDILLSEKIRLAKEYHIQTKTVIHIPADIPLHPADWTTIFANILDNAIEASSQIPEQKKRRFDITLKYKKGYLSAKIMNTFHIPPKFENGDFITHKNDATIHGLGLINTKRTIEKYNGVMDISFDETSFSLTLMLDTTTQPRRTT